MDKIKKTVDKAKKAWYKLDKEKWMKRFGWLLPILKSLKKGTKDWSGLLALVVASATQIGPVSVNNAAEKAVEKQMVEQREYFILDDESSINDTLDTAVSNIEVIK